MVLKDTEKQITVQTFSQATPVPLAEFLKKIKLDKDLNTLTNEEGLATYIIVSKGDIILYKRPSPSYSFKFNALVFFEKNLTLKVQLFLIFVH